MKKKKSNLVLFSLFFLIVVLAEIYVLLELRQDYFVVGGISIVFVISAYLVLDGLKTVWDNFEEHLYTSIDSHLEEEEKIQRALYKVMKNLSELTNERLSNLENVISASITEIEGEIRTVGSLIKGSIKYDRENAKQIIATEKTKLESLTAALERNHHQLQQDLKQLSAENAQAYQSANLEINHKLEHTEATLKTYESLINTLSHQLESIYETMVHVDSRLDVISMHPVAATAPVSISTPMPVPIPVVAPETTIETMPEPVTEQIPEPEAEPEVSSESEDSDALLSMEHLDELNSLIDTFNEETAVEDAAQIESEISAETEPEAEVVPEPEVIPEPEAVSEPVSAPATPVLDVNPADANKQLSADEIAALFAAANTSEPTPAPVSEPEPAPEENLETEVKKAESIKPVLDINPADANKQLSADEIAALFASLGQ